MQIEIWSDVICPWCYIGKRRLELALDKAGMRRSVQVIWRSFELNPQAQAQYPGTLNEMLARKYGVSLQQAETMNAHVTRLASEVGLEYRLSEARPGNTFDAHRLLHFAAARNNGASAAECIMHAYFCEALPVGDRAALARIAPKFGIAEEEAAAMLDTDEYSNQVRADELRAAEIGIEAVPYFLFDRKYRLAGAQPVDVLTGMLRQT